MDFRSTRACGVHGHTNCDERYEARSTFAKYQVNMLAVCACHKGQLLVAPT